MKNNKSDAFCQVVDHTHKTSTSSCQSHQLITGKTIIILDNLTLQTRHTVDRVDMGTYFVMF